MFSVIDNEYILATYYTVMKKLWEDTLKQLELNLSSQHFTTWIKPLKLIKIDQGDVFLEVPNRFILDWVKENCMKDKTNMELTADTSFLAHNILDSLAFLKLVTHLEETYSISIDEDDMSPDNFESATTVAALVDQLKS